MDSRFRVNDEENRNAGSFGASSHSLMTSERILLELRSVSKAFGLTRVLEDINLEVRDGEFITILGPSGSGKTTILRMIGGFVAPTSGEIRLDGRDIVRLAINRRPFNTVFQDYALFPHMTVAANVGYGLMVRGMARPEISKRVGAALELVQLGALAKRYPAALSGGQRQRVALARAIICEPRLILLDEPLAALDVELRKQMQLFLKDIQREIKTTFLFVTHDQEEAIAIADRICVMNFGRILQLGTPPEVYYRPQSEFVARFFGDNNLIEGILGAIEGERRRITTPIGEILCAVDDQPAIAAAPAGARAFAVFRPESASLAAATGENRARGRVAAVSFGGATTVALLDLEGKGGPVAARLKLPSRVGGPALAAGEAVEIGWPAAACRLVLA
jgi:spermidine/putrescine transport system ATP-binding protein